MATSIRKRLATPRWLIAGIVAMVAIARLPSFFHQLFDGDEAAIAAQAISIRDGGTLYVDAIDRKPPLPPYLYAWSFELFGSTDLRPLHVLAAMALAGAALAVSLDVRRRAGTAAGWWAAGLMISGAVAFYPVNGQAANYAHFALLPGAIALVAARRGRTGTAVLAGVALGLAVLCRQTWAIGLLPAVLAAWLSGRRRDAVAVVLGAVATVAAVGLVVPFGGFWHWTFSSNESFVLGNVDAGAVLRTLRHASWLFLIFHLALVALLVAAGWSRLRTRSEWRRDADLWLWLLTACVAICTGFRFYGHYWLQAVPPAVALAAPVAARLGRALGALAGGAIVVSAAVAVAMAFTPQTYRPVLESTRLTAYVDAHSTPDQRILMWGDYMEIYWSADRAPAGAFVHSGFVTGFSGHRAVGLSTLQNVPPGATATFLRSLRSHRPAVIVDTSTTNLRHYGVYPMSVIPELAAFVAAHYREDTTIAGITLYLPDGR